MDLLQLTYDLVSIPSVSYEEEQIAAFVADRLQDRSHLEITRIGNNTIARTQKGADYRVVLAGHLDTVPFGDSKPIELSPPYVTGRGSVDMKGGLAVLMKIVAESTTLPVDVTFVAYAKEEVKRVDSGLLEVKALAPQLLECDMAVLAEPTNGFAEVGCQGVMRVELTLGGVAAHTARAWKGTNAIHRAGRVIEETVKFGYREVVVDGVAYRESLQIVKIEGGRATNVVPDELKMTISYRFAPNASPEQAYAFLNDLFSSVLNPDLGDCLQLTESAPPAGPRLLDPGIKRLTELTDRGAKAKLGWTDVAFFAEQNTPAVNFGPGEPELSHGANEAISEAELEECYGVLWQFLENCPPRA